MKEQRANPSGSAIQTTAAVVVAVAAVFSVIAQSKDNPKLAIELVGLSLLLFAASFANRLLSSFQASRVRAARDRAARAEHSELLRFGRRFAQFTNSGDWSNLRNIVCNVYGNDPDKCAEVCPPDYMRDLFPLFVQHLEKRPSENETQFLLAVQELYGLVASYNNHYVLEPFRRMRQKRWCPKETSNVVPNHVLWIESLSEGYRANTERQIEDFRERWVSFLDDMKEWLERTNESFGVSLPVYFDRPHKL